MTRERSADPWSDERLEAAFATRAGMAPPTPSDLEDHVIATVSHGHPRIVRWPFAAGGAALALVALVVVGSSLVRHPDAGPSSPPAAPSGPPASSAAFTALGPPITVSAALEAREADDGSELVVSGFLSPDPPPSPCPASLAPENPTRLRCPARWLMEYAEQLPTIGPYGFLAFAPSGPALQPSFALVDAPDLPIAGEGPVAPLPVLLVGHFDDRRAMLCEAAEREVCGETFVVDRVLSVDGEEQPVRTDRRTDATPDELEQDVDALIRPHAPDAVVLSRQLMTIGQALEVEPVLLDHQAVPHIADQSTLVWIVTTVDLRDGRPIARTFMLLDGSNWFVEVTRDGAQMLERMAANPTWSLPPVLASPDPEAFAAAPDQVLGLEVQRVAEVAPGTGPIGSTRDEFAIRAWYLAPRPGIDCAVRQEVEILTPPCDEARHWLLDDPRQYGNTFGQLRSDPDHAPKVLNPLLPIDVPFSVGDTWRGDVPVPQPVVVLGHFNDRRVDAYHGGAYLVVDALAWTRSEGLATLDRVVRLSNAATEAPADVVARVSAVSMQEPLATWVSLVDGGDVALVDHQFGVEPREFVRGEAVWIVRQLVDDETDEGLRRAVVTAYTRDGSARVWLTSCPDCEVDLGTSIDVRGLDDHTDLVRVFDRADSVVDARPAQGFDTASWHPVSGNATCGTEVARAGDDNSVGVRWRGGLAAATWHLTVFDTGQGWIYVQPNQPSGGCGSDSVIRGIVLEFDHPVDVRRFSGNSCCG